ncbi:hypothetical protein TIFTF001_010241 [Ficus carica]|uniref:Uncharacterized protein n=1 Tax=Ficus carica TaxID=3494 RepID=A0AA87ZW45_FICCA|nr:hypothetical protein TIFTF001_010241 [Ficus carica]
MKAVDCVVRLFVVAGARSCGRGLHCRMIALGSRRWLLGASLLEAEGARTICNLFGCSFKIAIWRGRRGLGQCGRAAR